MTTIAWDGHTLAADTLICDGDVKRYGDKIWRDGPVLIGVSGDLAYGLALRWWYNHHGADPDKFPVPLEGQVGRMLVVIDKQAFLYENAYPMAIQDKYATIGSGRAVAAAVMELGHDAVSAVRMAVKLDIHSGGDVRSLEWQL